MSSQGEPSMLEVFLRKFRKIVLENLSNEQFGTNELARKMGLSRSQIHRKLQKINGKSITQFIREIRLEEGLKMIKGNIGTAAEISYKAGFNSPAYFNKCFREYFGITPGDVGKIPLKRKNEKRISLNKLFQIISWKTAAFLCIALLGVWLFYYFILTKNNSGNITETKTSIAVLPFINLTGDTSLYHLQYGISELLISALSTSPELIVTDNQTITDVIGNLTNIQTSSMKPKMAKEIVKRLKVGSYMYEDSIFRINLKLIDTKTGEIVKTRHIESKKNNIYYMAASLSNDIKNFLEIKIIGEGSDIEPLDFMTTSSSEAFKYYILGMEDLWKGKVSSKKKLLRAVEIDSNFTAAYFFLGLAYRSFGDYDQSIECYDRAYKNKEKAPEKFKLWLEAWKTEYTDQNPAGTINYYREVTKIDPLSRLNWYFLGRSYFLIKKYDEAIMAWEEITNIDRQLGGPYKRQNYYINCGYAYHTRGKHRKEKKIYKKGLKLFPDDRRLICRQAICALSQGKTKLADKYVEQHNKALEKLGWSESYITFWAGVIYRNGCNNNNKTVETLRHALALRLKDKDNTKGNEIYWYYYYLAEVLIYRDINVEGGIEYIKIALELSNEDKPDYPWFTRVLGWGYYKQGKYTEALHLLKKAEEGTPFYSPRLQKNIQEVEEAIARENEGI